MRGLCYGQLAVPGLALAEDAISHPAKKPIGPSKTEMVASLGVLNSRGASLEGTKLTLTVSSWMPFKYNSDGSLDLYFQNESPGADKEANWLPAPKGPFTLTMRIYAPKSDALTGKWNPPPVTKAAAQPGLPQ